MLLTLRLVAVIRVREAAMVHMRGGDVDQDLLETVSDRAQVTEDPIRPARIMEVARGVRQCAQMLGSLVGRRYGAVEVRHDEPPGNGAFTRQVRGPLHRDDGGAGPVRHAHRHSRQAAPVASVFDAPVKEFTIFRAAGEHVAHPDLRSGVAGPGASNVLTSKCMSSGKARDCAGGIAEQTPISDTGNESGHEAGW
ncbi:hypothetical protein [Georgenia sp. H159]|uniref:hypothetical protein n=1 Tax=Georgenia sp. H159 TaxID=3076115 RepID=UPI002D786E09|nr:hypothetical protein [Georgenia sp. H159]